ncbi:class I SAM-dependent methyltransferase [Candidatus Daviesbacteria bacterium]|nr:class I SAM-dependent methyltransferase [Candidatus Daviesbacteria bacterium]
MKKSDIWIPGQARNDSLVTANLRGFEIKFRTKPGVFSKHGLDLGSRLLIEMMEINNGSSVADLGCGTGIIGFVAAKLNTKGVTHLFDVNLRVINLAKENAKLNKLENIKVCLSDNFSAEAHRKYDLILSNPAQHLGNEYLEEATKACVDHLKENGHVYWVIQSRMKPFVKRLFEKYFSSHEIIANKEGYVVLKATKYG